MGIQAINSSDQIFWSVKTTAHMLDMSVTSLYRLNINDPTFPRKIRLGKNKVGWSARAVTNWLEAISDV